MHQIAAEQHIADRRSQQQHIAAYCRSQQSSILQIAAEQQIAADHGAGYVEGGVEMLPPALAHTLLAQARHFPSGAK